MKVKMESLKVFASSIFKWRVLERRLAFMRSPHSRTLQNSDFGDGGEDGRWEKLHIHQYGDGVMRSEHRRHFPCSLERELASAGLQRMIAQEKKRKGCQSEMKMELKMGNGNGDGKASGVRFAPAPCATWSFAPELASASSRPMIANSSLVLSYIGTCLSA